MLSISPKGQKAIQSVLTYAGCVLVALVMASPLYWMVSVSIRPLGETFVPSLLPTAINLRAYVTILTSPVLRMPFMNSLLVASGSTLLALALGLPAGYGLSRYRFRAHSAVMMYTLANKMFPPVLLSVGYFALISRVRLYDTLWGLILMDTVVTLPFALWMMRNYFDTVPPEIDEAAIVDGTTRLGALFRVVLPVSVPGVAATVVYCFLLAWNEFLFAYIFTQSPTRRVIPVLIAGYQGQFYTDYPTLLAFAVLFVIPIVALFVIMQRYLIRGLAAGSIK